MRFEISDWMAESLSSTFVTFSVSSPVPPSRSVVLPSSATNRSRSFSCSLRTFMMKSRASKASSFVGFFDMVLSSAIQLFIDVLLIDKRSESRNRIWVVLRLFIL